MKPKWSVAEAADGKPAPLGNYQLMLNGSRSSPRTLNDFL
jgi:hypothetical protein